MDDGKYANRNGTVLHLQIYLHASDFRGYITLPNTVKRITQEAT
jgi:hypothetical protein